MNGTVFPLFLSLRVALSALVVIVPIGLVLGYLQARRDYRGRSLVDVLIVLPIVLPPSVTGYYLIIVLGRKGIVGGPLYELMGVSIIFTFWAAVIAAVVVSLPLFIKFAQAAFQGVDPDLEAVARFANWTATAERSSITSTVCCFILRESFCSPATCWGKSSSGRRQPVS